MAEYRRTRNITDIDWNRIFKVYETVNDCAIDGAVDIRSKWYAENEKTMGRRLGACTVYYNNGPLFGAVKFRDEILSDLGIYLGYEEIR